MVGTFEKYFRLTSSVGMKTGRSVGRNMITEA